jgi:chorismate mutase
MTAMVRAIRGAITVEEDTAEAIREQTQLMMSELVARNDLRTDDIISVVFATTPDLTSGFPATAARALGLGDTPLLGTQEVGVSGALERCVRVLVHAYSTRSKAEIHHVYLGGARALRTDLFE